MPTLRLAHSTPADGSHRVELTLAEIASLRFDKAREGERPEQELRVHLDEAKRLYQEALELRPEDDLHGLAVTHNQLGALYSSAGDLDRAVHHLRESIRLHETHGDHFSAARGRSNVSKSNHGYNGPELNRILKMTEANRARLLEAWHAYFAGHG